MVLQSMGKNNTSSKAQEIGIGRLTDVEQLPQYHPYCFILLGNLPDFGRVPFVAAG
ncbi:MAG: hypothetical protein MUE38_07870 [Flavihumibacter sp.]|jgi:hypothetical protein|nr:hypothetical protein [Flavihumibacter sp.]